MGPPLLHESNGTTNSFKKSIKWLLVHIEKAKKRMNLLEYVTPEKTNSSNESVVTTTVEGNQNITRLAVTTLLVHGVRAAVHST